MLVACPSCQLRRRVPLCKPAGILVDNSTVRAAPERDVEPLSTIRRYESALDHCLAARRALPALFCKNDRVGPGALGEASGGVGSPHRPAARLRASLSIGFGRYGSYRKYWIGSLWPLPTLESCWPLYGVGSMALGHGRVVSEPTTTASGSYGAGEHLLCRHIAGN